jgi:hypothetical protein
VKQEYQLGAPLPGSIGLCADLFAEVRDLRLAMQKLVDEVKARESEIRDHIIDNLSKSDDTGAAGKRYRAQVVRKVKPALKDWIAFTEFVAMEQRFDLLQKRMNERAVLDMLEEGQSVPGIERFNAVDVSITKI